MLSTLADILLTVDEDMVRAALHPSRQIAVGAIAVAAALTAVVSGVWLSATGEPRLDPPSGRSTFEPASAAVLDAARLEGIRALPAPDAVTIALLSASDATADLVVSAPPGGGLAAQPPAQPPPPSPPPGADADPVEEAVTTLEETLEETVKDVEETADELDPARDVIDDDPLSLL